MFSKAFSLIELMVVIAIIAILAAIALPLYQYFTCKTRASESLSVLRDIKGSIQAFTSTDIDFTAAGADWSNTSAIANTLNVQIPKARWTYEGTATPSVLSIEVKPITGAGIHPSCITGLVYTWQAVRLRWGGVGYRVSSSTHLRYVKTTELTGRI